MEPEGPRCVSKPFLVPGMIISFCKGLSYIHGLRNQSLETVCSSSGCLSWQELLVWAGSRFMEPERPALSKK